MLVKKCRCCGDIILDSDPKYEDDNDLSWVCGDCAFINGYISEEEYIKEFLYFTSDIKWAEIRNGEIVLGRGKKKSISDERKRNSNEYQNWRAKVFTRDNFTCQICQKVGGELNAHHIRPYAKYEENRLDVDNGVTLCITCHKMVHKTKNREFLKGV